MFNKFKHIKRRRQAIRAALDVNADFKTWEESCVPSYVHPNLAAALVSWLRLFAAVELADRYGSWGAALDFGASIGELGHLLPKDIARYHFVEEVDTYKQYLVRTQPEAVEETLESAPDGAYGVVFALDSLEHNENYSELLAKLRDKLRPDGVLILSGPTENWIYRLGRRLAGFQGGYHVTQIYSIEAQASRIMDRVACRSLPFGISLFRITVWKKRE